MRAGTSAPSLVPRAWTASRWSGSTTPATARHRPAPLPTCPGRPLPPAQAAPQAGLGRRAAGRARGLPGRCQCPNQRRQLPAGAAAFTVITGQFLGSATDYPLCAATTPESPRLRTAQLGGYARCWPGGSTTLGDLLADGQTGGQLAEPPGVSTPARGPGLRGVGDGACCRCVRQ